MKKVLLGTSAIALVGMASAPATAAEWDLEWGGYMEAYAAYADSDITNGAGSSADVGGIDSKIEGEIDFTPSITLDNGIQFGVNVQLEDLGSGTGDIVDESFLFIDASFGEINLGSENSAGYKMSYAAPDVTFLNVNSGTVYAFVPFSGFGLSDGIGRGSDVFRGTLGSTYLENARNNDAERFTYYTPRFAGVQLGVSYARDASQDNNAQQDLNGAAVRDLFDIGANYVNSFGDFDIAVSGRYGFANDDRPSVPGTDIGENPQVFAAGVNLGFAGITVGGSYGEQNNSGNDDGQSYDAGISYSTGPWGVSFTYFHGENVDDENEFNVLGNDEELDAFLLGLSYKIGKGVTANAFGSYIDFEEEIGDAGGRGDDVDGFIVGTAIKVSF